MAQFRRRTETELSELDDEALVAYVAAAREAGDLEMAKRACAVLAWGHGRTIRARVARKVPPADVEDVVGDVFESVVRSVFDSHTIGQFGAWLRTITLRRIADYHRAREGKPPLGPIPDGDPEDTGIEPGREEDGYADVDMRAAAVRILDARGRPEHVDVIKLYGPHVLGYLALSAAETVERIAVLHPSSTMSEANVHQIWTRFKRDLHDELGLGGS